MKPSEQIQQLEKEKAALQEQVNGLLKRIQELEAAKPKSKSRAQAEEGLKMLLEGPVSLAQFTTLNPKYPGDVAYYIRNILKVDLKTIRTTGGTLYMLPDQHASYLESQARQKAQEKASKEEAKEEIQAAPIPQSPQTAAAGAALAV